MSIRINPISTTLADARKCGAPRLDTIYDAIVIGSGYGGAISAQMLTEAGQKVLLLERGREILPGHYPRDLEGAARETQITTAKDGRLTDANGMLDLRIAGDMSVVIGCGLGGTSLINANVALPADKRVFDQTDADGRNLWPAEYRSDGPAWAEGETANSLPNAYKAARHGLGSTPLPERYDLPKLRALAQSAKALNQPFERPPINVTFENGINAFGNPQAACTLCGDCCGGCNYGAKNTTLMNYLPHAAANGAAIVTEAEVSTVTQAADGTWSVRAASFGEAAESGLDLKARRVVLAAGTLGSTEILTRSARAGLPVAQSALGARFSGNGDVLAFGFDANVTGSGAAQSTDTDPPPVHSIGAGAHDPTGHDGGPYRPGPCITGTIRVDMDDDSPLKDGVLIEEGVAPGALSMIYPAIFFGDDVTTANFTRFSDATRRLQDIATLGTDLMQGKGLAGLSYSGATARMQSYLLMSHDDAGGQIVLDDRHSDAPATVSWPGVGSRFPFPRDNALLREASDAIEANYLPNPIWSEPYGWKLVTTHPVGGCRMADSPEEGVVDANCRVFTGDGAAVHEGLMVCDGAVVASSLGVNPLLTISAITIRAMTSLIEREGWQTKPMKPASSAQLSDAPPPAPPSPLDEAAQAIEDAIHWLETMADQIDEDPKKMRKTLRKRVEALFAGMGYLKRKLLHLFTRKAFNSARMTSDVAPALRTLAGYLAQTGDVLRSDKPEAGIIQELIALLTDTAGEFQPGLAFSEEMAGHLSEARGSRPHPISDAYAIAARQGDATGYAIDGLFMIVSTDVNHMLDHDRDHKAELSGVLTLTAPDGTEETLTLRKATFQLLRQDAAEVDCWQMVYDGELDSGGHFRGVKTLRRRGDSNWWTDLTTLDVDLTRDGKPALRGRMTLDVQDLVKQAQTVHGTMANEATLTGLAWDVLRRIWWGDLSWLVTQKDFLNRAIRYAINHYAAQSGGDGDDEDPAAQAMQALTAMAAMEGAQFFGRLIFRAYGGLPAYLYNFPARDAPENPMPPLAGLKSEIVTHRTTDGAPIRLTRFRGGAKGPVILANGFGFKGMGFAMNTYPEGQDQSLVGMLAGVGYDVWIFDHRASPANDTPGESPAVNYTIDDIAAIDWPWAIETVREKTGARDVQLLVHCLGALTAMMSLMGGHAQGVRNMIVSQFSVHPVTGWFNQMKADTHFAQLLHGDAETDMAAALAALTGNPVIEKLAEPRDLFDLGTRVPPPGRMSQQAQLDAAIDALVYSVPFPTAERCYNPTCHRIFGVFGPVYNHDQLNAATHDALGQVVGPVATWPFVQLAKIMQQGRAVSANGKDIYFGTPSRLDFPIHFISGELNQLVLPSTTLRSQKWLQSTLPASAAKFTRQVYGGYGHMDCLVGRDAARDVIPDLIKRLNAHTADR